MLKGGPLPALSEMLQILLARRVSTFKLYGGLLTQDLLTALTAMLAATTCITLSHIHQTHVEGDKNTVSKNSIFTGGCVEILMPSPGWPTTLDTCRVCSQSFPTTSGVEFIP